MRLGFPRTVRIIRSEDFGELLHSDSPATIRLGRELASVSVILNSCVGRVRFGFTVGKHNAPRSVDRALVKRVMRDCCRNKLPQFRALAAQHGVGLEIGLRLRRPLGRVGSEDMTVDNAKRLVRESSELCLQAVVRRLPKSVSLYRK